MKKFLSKYGVVIGIVLLLGLFIGLSVLIKEDSVKEMSSDIQNWLTDTASDEYVVTVIAQTTCGHCINFKPVMTKAHNKNDFKLYWFEADELSTNDYNTLKGTYELDEYSGTPYTFITKNGEVLDHISGEREYDVLIDFLKENNVIK